MKPHISTHRLDAPRQKAQRVDKLLLAYRLALLAGVAWTALCCTFVAARTAWLWHEAAEFRAKMESLQQGRK